MNGVQTRLKCKPNVKRCKRFVFAAHSPLLHPNTLKTKAIIHFQTDHILTRFVFPPLRNVLEVLRQPLEDRKITVSRIRCNVEYPASFMLVASMNPCPCGYYTHPTKACVCSPGQVQKYLNRISGPLLDRIDLQIEVTPLPFEEMADSRPGESSATIRERVIRARQIQEARYADIPGIYCNAQMNSKLLARHARPNDKGLAMLKTAMNRLNLSARAYDRILKVSRTIADLEGCELIQPAHLAEAIGYRNLDREDWAG